MAHEREGSCHLEIARLSPACCCSQPRRCCSLHRAHALMLASPSSNGPPPPTAMCSTNGNYFTNAGTPDCRAWPQDSLIKTVCAGVVLVALCAVVRALGPPPASAAPTSSLRAVQPLPRPVSLATVLRPRAAVLGAPVTSAAAAEASHGSVGPMRPSQTPDDEAAATDPTPAMGPVLAPGAASLYYLPLALLLMAALWRLVPRLRAADATPVERLPWAMAAVGGTPSAEPGPADAAAARAALKAELATLLGDAASGAQRTGRSSTFAARARVEQVVRELEALNPTPVSVRSPLLLGEWRLLTTFKPGIGETDFWSIESWRKYIWEQGPSPVQTLVLGSGNTSNVSQVLQDPTAEGNVWQNAVQFGGGLRLVIEAALEGVRDDTSFFYRFEGGFVELPSGGRLPYPVPFGLLERLRPGQTKGWFATTYLDEDLRVSVGNKGSVFVLRRIPPP